MNWSKYNYSFKHEKFGHLLYNSLSNSFAEISEEIYTNISNMVQDPKLIQKLFTEEEYNELIKAKVITENDNDEFYDYKTQILLNRYNREIISLSIAPTQACNFNCSYCYETARPDIYMNDSTEDKIIEFISSFKEAKHLHVTWYGGEPLMAFDRIISLTEKFKKLDLQYSAGMISNGFLLTEEKIISLESLNINSIQITIDGLEETHNSRRPALDNSSTFNTIIQNIAKLFELNKNVQVRIRVNIDKTNENQYSKVCKFLSEKLGRNNYFIRPGFIIERNNCHSLNDCSMDRKSKAKFTIEQYEKYGINNLDFYPRRIVSECTARHINGYVIGPGGELYKCWNDIGIKEKEITNLHNKLQYNKSNQLRYLTGADALYDKKCVECFYLPVCAGGCAYDRLENEFNNAQIDTCVVSKGNLQKFLETHYEIKNSISAE